MSEIDLDQTIALLKQRRAKINEVLKLQSEIARMESNLVGKGEVASVARIVCEIVCKEFSVDPQDVIGRCRREEYVVPRHVMFYILYSDYNKSSEVVGRALGRDHGSVLYAVAAIEERIETDMRFATRLASLREQCRSRLTEAPEVSKAV